jgi:hypothetical protein
LLCGIASLRVLPYFLIWAWIGWSALSGRQRWSQLTSVGIWLVFTLLIGLRIEIGADWSNYLQYLERQINMPLIYPLISIEPGYALANWISVRLNWDIFGVNLICGGLFSAGLVRYCRNQPYPWLALALAFPYLAIVVAMGYSRQGVAIGLELLALLALERDRLLQFLAWLGLASTFHASAFTMLVLPFNIIRGSMVRIKDLLRLLFLAGAGYGLFDAIFSGLVKSYQEIYLEAQYQSEGALIRVVLCLLPALIFLWKRHEFPISPQQRSIYTLMSWLAVAAGIGLILSLSSTAVDRVALYLIPLQIFVGSYLPLIRLQGLSTVFWRKLLVLFSFAVLSVWLFFADHASAWIPYRNFLFEF